MLVKAVLGPIVLLSEWSEGSSGERTEQIGHTKKELPVTQLAEKLTISPGIFTLPDLLFHGTPMKIYFVIVFTCGTLLPQVNG